MIYRAWVNQPSTLQPLHDRHGEFCIVNDKDPSANDVDIYFTTGDVHSMSVSRLCISRVYLSKAEQS